MLVSRKIQRGKEEERSLRQRLPTLAVEAITLSFCNVASVDQGFGFTPTDAVYHYHSIYDTQAWQQRYAEFLAM